jgi:hypothetical protein
VRKAVELLISAEDDADRRAALSQPRGDFRRLSAIEGSVLDSCADAEAATISSTRDIELPVGGGGDRPPRAWALDDIRGAESAARKVGPDERPSAAPSPARQSALFNASGRPRDRLRHSGTT